MIVLKILKVFLFVILFAGIFLRNTPAYAYEEVDVSRGGKIAGRITLKGDIPKPRVFSLSLYPFGTFCKKISDGKGHVLLKDFVVGDHGGLWNAVIAIQSVEKGKPFPLIQREFVAVDCMFHPADVAAREQFFTDESGQMYHEHPNVAILENHQPISVINQDPIVHNIQVFQNERGNIILNSPLPVSTRPRGGGLHFDEGKRISQMICGMHEFMQSWGFVVNNPYYAMSAKDGTYEIDQILPGEYTVSIWHPHYKIYEKKVVVPENGTVKLDFEFDASIVKRPLYESQRRFRMDPATPIDHLLHEGDDRLIIAD
ncbi:MAG: carboxypeptidase-like regulatory domain-containing protein [Nitrospiria bacterium]